MTTTAPQLLTTREAATALRVSRGRVRELLPVVALPGRRPRYDAADLARLISQSKQQPTTQQP